MTRAIRWYAPLNARYPAASKCCFIQLEQHQPPPLWEFRPRSQHKYG